MTDDKFNPKYYINVKALMSCRLPRPRLKPTVIVNYGEFLPIISIGIPGVEI